MISFKELEKSDITTCQKWFSKPHVKNVWFIEGYETQEYFEKKIFDSHFDFPFIIELNQQPIGYIQYSDLYQYYFHSPDPSGAYRLETIQEGTYCIDLFIGEEKYLNKGIGTEIVQIFTQFLFQKKKALKILIDPAITNFRAIQCYLKCGYRFQYIQHDGVTYSCVLEKRRESLIDLHESRIIDSFLIHFSNWCLQSTSIERVYLLGSHAISSAKESSDIDLCILTHNLSPFLENTEWVSLFGKVQKIRQEEYAKVTSLRVYYLSSSQWTNEIEYSFTHISWDQDPIDEETQKVLMKSRLIFSKQQVKY